MNLKDFYFKFLIAKAFPRLLIILFLSCLLNFSVFAERGDFIAPQSRISFYGSSNFHSFQGNIKKFKGFIYSDSQDVKNVSYIQLEFDPWSFSTNNTARDENMRKTLSKSLIRFRSTNVLVSHDGAFVDITGRLTIKDITKRVVFTAFLNKPSSKEVRAVGAFWIKLSDFNLKPPAPAFIRLNDKVQVKFEVIANWPH